MFYKLDIILFRIIYFLGVKTEIRSPGLAESDCVATTQDSASFYSTPIDLGNLYDKDYHQTYSAAHSYYNR